MKKMILGVAALSMLALVSCKKEYSCECTTSLAGVQTGVATTTIKDTKKNATTACEDGSSSSSVGGQTIAVTCVIK